jgi:cellulose synthase/poly-beta-1,6-N-acetylglucosamine synthase-like glycosyltransferase
MGDRYLDVRTPAGRTLVPAGDADPDLVIPETDYVMTVDADSVILPEYALRLVYLLEQAENSRVAVAQSPYSAFPGAATRIERIAGATTDLQHIIHQGMTYYGASFWVGANAVLRKAALDDIAETEYIGGYPIHRYISDRTVIEDTESTIDLAAGGWSLHNYPERLAYSATPPDFGSLCIQRHRWSNGGLLIVPKLVRCIHRRRRRPPSGPRCRC